MLRQVCPLGRSRYRYFAREVLTIPKKQEKMTQKPDVPSKYEFLHTLAKPEARDAGKVFFFRPGRRRNCFHRGGSERPSQGRVAIVVGKKEDDDQPPPSPTT